MGRPKFSADARGNSPFENGPAWRPRWLAGPEESRMHALDQDPTARGISSSSRRGWVAGEPYLLGVCGAHRGVLGEGSKWSR
jgi:hypothetical protein